MALQSIINIHDVALAQLFAKRIIGLRQGEIVYDGPPDGLSAEVLTDIYGVEDWSGTTGKATTTEDEEVEAVAATGASAAQIIDYGITPKFFRPLQELQSFVGISTSVNRRFSGWLVPVG